MTSFRRSRFFRYFVLSLALTSVLSACYKWSTMHGPHDQAINYGRPDKVRVTVSDGSRIEIRKPWIQGDSILALSARNDTLAIGLSSISKLEERKFDWAAVAGGYLFLSLVSYVIVCTGEDSWAYGC
ncbi:MAG: hypothetical protein OEM23_04020 [Gemmatimonadota bacterium]|nr:hypothetical protein [Gemmatimonadota bacterium]MDH3427581.1 hypothetical protein [Gemmatimonadota bacterium]